MHIDQIISQFTSSPPGLFPKDALQAAFAKEQEITPVLVDILSKAGADIEGLAKRQDDNGFLYAMFLLAQFREQQGLAPLIAFFSNPGQSAITLTGDVVTENLGQLLAGTSGNDIRPIQAMIENSTIDPFVRGAGLEALLCLVAWGETSPRGVITYFAELLESKLERQPCHAWNYLSEAICRLCGPEFIEPLKKAYDQGLISPLYMKVDEAEKMLNRPTRENRADLEDDTGLRAITNVVAEMEGWACFRPQEERIHHQGIKQTTSTPKKTGRNEPCPCGSGKKYKKCCLGI